MACSKLSNRAGQKGEDKLSPSPGAAPGRAHEFVRGCFCRWESGCSWLEPLDDHPEGQRQFPGKDRDDGDSRPDRNLLDEAEHQSSVVGKDQGTTNQPEHRNEPRDQAGLVH